MIEFSGNRCDVTQCGPRLSLTEMVFRRGNVKITLLRSFAPCLWLLAIAGLAEADDSQPLPTRFPAGPLAYAELTGLDEVVVRFEKSAFWKSVRETPQAQAFYQSTNYRKVEAFRDLSSRMIEQDILEFMRRDTESDAP